MYTPPGFIVLIIAIVLLIAYILLINLFIGVVEAKGFAVASWQLWFLGIVFTPLAVALYAAILPDRG